MVIKKVYLVLSLFFIFCVKNSFKSQSNVGIILNEYATTNYGSPVDNFGIQSDWVEVLNPNTYSVNLGGYWLSNDRFNLFKWRIPNGFILGGNQLQVIWLSGKNTVAAGNYHANFTLDQCKNQWLILSTAQGVVRDSVFIQKTQAGHTRGRVDIQNIGISNWKLYTSHSFLQPNPTVNNFIDYCPMPKIVSDPIAGLDSTSNINTGSFYPSGNAILYFKLNGQIYDTLNRNCFDIFYTTDGSFPVPGYPTPGGTTVRYTDKLSGSPALTFVKTTMVRAIAIPSPIYDCFGKYLPSFCETNTYFIDAEHNAFSEDFGVISLAMDENWLETNGAFSPTIHAEYYDKKKQMCEGYAFISRPINESWITKQKGFNINIDDRSGFGCGFEGKIFNVDGLGTSERTSFPVVHLKAGDNESHSLPSSTVAISQGTGIRDVFMQSLAAKYDLNVNPLHVKPVITFVNGAYWGVYDLREVFDKHYENYYNKQSKDSLDMNYYHNSDGTLNYKDGSVSTYSYNYHTRVYNSIINGPLTSVSVYTNIMVQLDKSSFIDYHVLNNFAMNRDLWTYNVAFAKGWQPAKNGNKWHYYLWNMPSIFNYLSLNNGSNLNNICNLTLCDFRGTGNGYPYTVSPLAGNAHGMMLRNLMNTTNGVNPITNTAFQLEYRNRYQDLLNSALKCENLLKHFDYIQKLYSKEMKYHEDPASAPLPGKFSTAIDTWDTNMVRMRKAIDCRCNYVVNNFNKPCFTSTGPFNLTVDVEPAGAGKVRLNSVLLDSYKWSGSYYSTTLAFKAIPTNTTYVFDHWETKHTTLNNRPLSLDSIAISYFKVDDVIAVFTDKSSDLLATGENANVPTGFTPNGDGINDVFKPLGSARFTSEYDFAIWSRWGEEVFRTTNPDTGWDGNYKGQQAVTGVYAYVISYKNIYGETKFLKGNITLTR
jgi:gliding motility-associated-like protein